MSTPTKQRATKWNAGDNSKFFELHKSGKIDIKSTDPAYIKSIRDKHWPGRSNKTFLNNWKKAVANIIIQGSLNGARASAAAANTTEAEEANDFDGEDIDDSKMPASASVEDLAGALNDSGIFKTHSLEKTVPFMVTTYPKGDKNMVEVELTVEGHYPSEDAFQTVVSEDRNSLEVAVGTDKKFASLARKGRQLGLNFHENDVRYMAYDDSVQKVRKDDKEKLKGEYYFGNPQEIILPFPCLRTIVKKKLQHHAVNVHTVSGVNHHQFKTWYTLLLEGVERRIGVEHAAHSATYTYTADEERPIDSDEE